MALKRWILILILAALPAVASAEQPFNAGDVVATSKTLQGFNFFVSLYRRGSGIPSRFSPEIFRGYPSPDGPMTYSPALNRMILSTGGPTTTLETLDTDGHVTMLPALPNARVTALAGIGPEILAVVVVASPYQFELWRIAAAEGTVTERIPLPFSPPPLQVRDITSIDLAGDGCTLAYAVPPDVIYRYDICARRPLEAVATGPASAVRFLPQGNLLVLESHPSAVPRCPPPFCYPAWSRLARYDREGRLVSTIDVIPPGSESITAMALDSDGSTAWVVTDFGFLRAVNASSGALIAGPWPGGFGVGVAVAGEWRASAHPPARGRAIR